MGRRGARMVVLAGRSPIGRENAGGSQAHLPQKTRWVRLFFVDGPISLSGGGEAGGNWIRQGVVMERRRVRWPTVLLSSATDGGLPLVLARFVRGLSTHQGSGCRRRLRTAATAAKCHRAPVDSHRVADQMPTGPSDEPTTSTARRVAAATWMMSSTTVASRAYAVVPARRSRWSRSCCRARGTDRNWTLVDRKMSWSPAASSSQQRARVLTDVKARRFAPPPLRGADGLDAGSAHARPDWLLPTMLTHTPPTC